MKTFKSFSVTSAARRACGNAASLLIVALFASVLLTTGEASAQESKARASVQTEAAAQPAAAATTTTTTTKTAATAPLTTEPVTPDPAQVKDEGGDCAVCHKNRETQFYPCNSVVYRRHIAHGDPAAACGATRGSRAE